LNDWESRLIRTNYLKNTVMRKIIHFIPFVIITVLTLSAPCQHPVVPASAINSFIVLEETDINITGLKFANLYVTFSKHLVILVRNMADTSRLCNITLPEPFDPSLIIQSPPERNAGFYFDKIKMNDFKAGIRLQGGQRKPAVVVPGNKEIQMASYWDNRYKRYYESTYLIRGVKSGDTLDIAYNYSIPYKENYMRFTSFRIFFHGSLFKDQYLMKLHFDPKLNVRFSYENNGNPDTIFTDGSVKTMVWKKNALPGCMDEPGAHPYFSLPHFVFTLLPNDMMYTIPYTFDYTLLPLYSLAAYYREQGTIKIIKAVALGTNNNQYRKIRSWVNDQTAGVIHDSTGYLKLSHMNDRIVDDFAYNNDLPYYRFIDEFDESMGDNLNNMKIRSISRYNLYPALIYSLKLNYFTAYIADKRSGVLSDEYVQPMFESDYLFAVPLNDGSLQFLYPKRGRTGYYMNEIPFYFENTKAQLVLIDDFSNQKKAVNDHTRFIDMPGSKTGDNFRKSNILVQIDLDSLKTEFSARVALGGQYSTLTRGVYLFNENDSTVNPAYWAPIWKVNDQVKVRSKETTIAEKVFPFKTNISATYDVPELISKSENEFVIDLANWFHFITYKGFSSDGRVQPFFSDFNGSDIYSYLLRFNKPVTLSNHTANTHVRNSFGEAAIEISQYQPNEILVTAKLITNAYMVEASKTNEVEEIYGVVDNLDKAKLAVTLK
jgi:hypothetical protein